MGFVRDAAGIEKNIAGFPDDFALIELNGIRAAQDVDQLMVTMPVPNHFKAKLSGVVDDIDLLKRGFRRRHVSPSKR